MKCEACRERLSELETGELGEALAKGVRDHLRDCGECSRLLAAMQATVELTADLPDGGPSRSLSMRILARVEEWLSPDPQSLPEIMTPEQLARFLNVPLEQLEIESLPGFEISGELRFRKDRVLEWIETREREYERGLIYAQYRA